MDFEQGLEIANLAVFAVANRHLSDIETVILRGAWYELTYEQIAEESGYSVSYIRRDVGAKFWKLLSQALGESVGKTNFREALKRRGQHQESRVNLQPSVTTTSLYVERSPIESICSKTLLQPGALVRVKAPTLMGKTFLMNRVLAELAAQDLRTVHFSFELADRKTHFSSLDRFLRWFCVVLSRELGMPEQIEDYWDEASMGSKVSCTTYVEEYLLAASDRPLVLCLDKVDLIFPYPEIYEDFFGLLRSWYEKARSRPSWQQLRLVIVHSTDVYIELNIHQSPFNIGLPIELTEFTQEQVHAFAQLHGLEQSSTVIPSLIDLIGGHPYLLELAFGYLKTHPNEPFDRFLSNAPTESGIYANHLRDHWQKLQQQPGLASALKTVMASAHPVEIEPVPAYQLQSRGLIKLLGNQAIPHCRLYQQYFQSRFQHEQ